MYIKTFIMYVAESYSLHPGWGKPQILVTLIMSGVLILAFFVIERLVKDPAVPSRIWFNKGAIPLFIYSLRYALSLTPLGFPLNFVNLVASTGF